MSRLGTHESGLLLRVRNTHHGSMARRLFVPFVWSLEVERGYAAALHSHCQTVPALTHYLLSAHVTVMA